MPYSVRKRIFRKEIFIQNYLYIIETRGGCRGEVGEGNRKEKKKIPFTGQHIVFVFTIQDLFYNSRVFSQWMIVGFTYCKKSQELQRQN